MVVLNYLGQRLRDKLLALQGRAGKVWLLDAEGYWLIGPAAEDEWGFMVPERSATPACQGFSTTLAADGKRKRPASIRGLHRGSSFARVFPLRMENLPAK
jgi:hypothetical protein